MQHRRTTFSALRSNGLKTRALIFVLVFTLSVPLHAVSLSQLKGMKGFQAAALAVAFVNKAMKEASANPMDAWRRQNVAHAVGLLPLAIRALAQDFQSGQLHDQDLKFVTGILGGFVDMSAPDKFQKFMKNPSDKSLIPQLGEGFPQEAIRKADEQGFPAQSKSIVFDENAKGSTGTLAQESSSVSASTLDGELANLNQALPVGSSQSGKSGKQTGNGAVSKSIIFDEGAPKNPSGNQVPLDKGGTSNFEATVAEDIASVEISLGLKPRGSVTTTGSTGGTAVLTRTADAVEKSSFNEDFFEEKKVSGQENSKSPSARALASERAKKRYKMTIQPKYWKLVPLLKILVKDAKGEGAQQPVAPPAPANPQDPKSNCPNGNCGGKGGGSPGGGGQGGGQGGADFLFGLAAIMAAAAPMVAAAMQADADKQIAKINSEAQIQMSEIAAENAKYMADSQSRTSEMQSKMAMDINKKNNDEQTKRLAMQLNEVSSARNQAYQSEVQRREEERRLNDEKIALAKRQADDNLKLAQASFNAQLTQAGLSTGFANVSRPGGNLTVDSVNSRPNLATNTPTLASANAASSLGTNFGNPNMTGPNLAASTGAANAAGMPATGQAMRGIASSKLITSAKNSKTGEVEEEEEVDPKDPTKKKKKTTARGVTSLKSVRGMYRGAYQVSTRTTTKGSVPGTIAYPDTAIGSTRAFHSVSKEVTETEKTKTDLASFADQATSSNRGFAAWRSTQPTPTVGEEVQRAASRGITSIRSGAYNAPDLSGETGSRGAIRGTHGGGTSEGLAD